MFKRITGVKSLSGTLNKVTGNSKGGAAESMSAAMTDYAEIVEFQVLEAASNRWMVQNYTFENVGTSTEFPTDDMYLARLDEGFYFPPLSAWEPEGDWVTIYDFDDNAPIKRRKRRWRRTLLYSESKAGEGGAEGNEEEGGGVSIDVAAAADGAAAAAAAAADDDADADADALANGADNGEGVSNGGFSVVHNADKGSAAADGGGDDDSDDDDDDAFDDEGGARGPQWEIESNFGEEEDEGMMSDGGGDTASVMSASTSATSTSAWGRPGPGAAATSSKRKEAITKEVTKLLSDASLQLKDKKVKELGKQIRQLEKECEAAYEVEKSDWKKNALPRMSEQVALLEASVAELRKRVEDEVDVAGVPHVVMLEKELQAHVEVLEDMKKKMYFPFSPFSAGSGGVYCAFDDIWLETMTGQMQVELSPHREKPYISLILSGEESGSGDGGGDADAGQAAADTTAASEMKKEQKKGMDVRFKIENFKSSGDAGKHVPKTTLSEVKVTITVVVSCLLTFDSEKNEWKAEGEDHLKIKLITFRGPFGFRKSMVNGILQLAAPKILAKVLEVLPPELGQFIMSMPSPFEATSQFGVHGTPLHLLTEEMAGLEDVCAACEASPLQLAMFLAMQRYTMERGSYHELKSVEDVIKYIKKYRRNTQAWRSICFNWEQACSLYCEGVQVVKAEEAMRSGASKFSSKAFEVTWMGNIVKGVEAIKRKQVSLRLRVDHVVGQASLNKMLLYFSQFFYRFVHKRKEGELQGCGGVRKQKVLIAKTLVMLDKIQSQYTGAMEAIREGCRNFDFAELKIRSRIHSGLDGYVRAEVKRLFAQFPLLLDTQLSKDKTIWGALVPFRFAVRPQSSGDVVIELAHVLELVTGTAGGDMAGGSGADNGGGSDFHSGSALSPLEDKYTTVDSKGGHASSRDHVLARVGTKTALPVHIYNDVYSHLNVTTTTTSEQDAHATFLGEENDQIDGRVMSVMVVSASKPHISIIVDRDETYKPGAELFTFMLGRERAKRKPAFGTNDMLETAEAREREYRARNMPPLFDDESRPRDFGADVIAAEAKAAEDHAAKLLKRMNGGGGGVLKSIKKGLSPDKKKSSEQFTVKVDVEGAMSRDFAASVRESVARFEAELKAEKERLRQERIDAREKDMPIFVQTAQGIKMLLQVPKSVVSLSLPSLVRFLAAHFVDLEALKIWLEDLTGATILHEQLAVGQVMLERGAKYVLLPGLDATFNLNVHILAQACEVSVRFETPNISDTGLQEEEDDDDNNTGDEPYHNSGGSTRDSFAGLTSDTVQRHRRASGNLSFSDKVEGNVNAVGTDGGVSGSPCPPSTGAGADAAGNSEQHDRAGEEYGGESDAAIQLNLVLNVMDVVDDFLSFGKAVEEAKRAYADYCSEKTRNAFHPEDFEE
jgi:hypothetical protein